MRFLALAFLLTALAFSGCVFDSKQITVAYEMQPDSLVVASTAALVACEVDLGRVASYQSHRGEIRGLADLALLGQVRNTGLTFIRLEWWLTRDATAYTTVAEVRANGIRLWGGFDLEPRGSRSLDWNKSAVLVDRAGLDAVSAEIRGDGAFTLYAISTLAGSGYSFTVEDPALVLILDTDS